MATCHRGQDGSVALGGPPPTVVGGVFGWTVVTDLAPLECTVMNEVWRTYHPGLPGWNGTMRCRFDNADGQDLVLATITGATPAGTLAEVQFRVDEDSYFHGAVVITGATITAELTNVIEAAYTYQGTGPLELVWV